MTEEDVKALHALNEDVAGAVRWLSGGAMPADMRLVNAAMLLTRAGLHIEKMIGDAEEAMAAASEVWSAPDPVTISEEERLHPSRNIGTVA